MTIVDFIQTYLSYAQVSEKYGVPAVFALAQSALETGWGKSTPGNMMFGIKTGASWKGKKQLLQTTEYHTGKNQKYPKIISIDKVGDKYKYVVKDYFRAYDSPAESFADHAQFLNNNKRYANAFKYSDNPEQFTNEIAKAGYATSPQYAEILKNTISKIKNSGLVKTLVIGGTSAAVLLGTLVGLMVILKNKR